MQRHIVWLAALICASEAPFAEGGEAEFYRSGFEGTDGGWTADADWDPDGDWERGVPVPGPFPGCSFGEGPGAAFEGKECWATQIDDCTTAVAGTSSLRQTFDFTTVVNGSLAWQQFLHIIGSEGNDRARVRINGDLVYEAPFTTVATDGYELQTVDLTPYNNLASVEIVFEFVSVSSIRRPGWYIDDVRITSLVDPNPGDLGVVVEDDPDPVTTVGDPIVYEVTAVNHGDAAASNVALTGTLDAATVFNAGLSSPEVLHDGSQAGGTFTVNVGNMDAFSAQSFHVGVDTTQLGSFSFNASISGDSDDPNAANDSRFEKTVVTIITDLSVALSSDQNPAITGTPYTYLVDVANLGPSEAVNAAWSLSLPENVSFLGASEGLHDGSSSGGVVSGTIASLPAAASHAISVDVIPNAGNLDDLVASPQVNVTDPAASDPDPANNARDLAIGHVASAEPFAKPVFTSTGFDFSRKKPLPTSEVPGVPGERFGFFARPHVSPDGGTWGLHAFLDTADRDRNEVIVLVDDAGARTVIYKGVTPMPDVKGETVGLIRDKFTINDNGCYALYADTNNFTDVILKGCGVNTAGTPSLVVVARQGNPVPGEPKGLLYSFGSEEPNLANDGTLRFFAHTQGAIHSDFNKFVVETPDDGLTVVKLLQEGVSIPAGQAGGAMDPWDDWRREFSGSRNGMYVTGDGAHTLLSGFTTGDAAMNDIVTFDDTVVVQEGVILDPVFTSPVQRPDGGLYLAPNGDWYARGVNADGTHWVVRNGEVLAKTGDEIFPGAGERWAALDAFPGGFTLVAADADGDYVIGGVTDAPVSGTAGFQPPPQVIVYNGQRVLMRSGDPVDVDGDGLFDDEGFIGFFEIDAAVLLGDGSLVAVAFVSAPFPFAGGVATTTSSESPAVIKTSAVRTGACCFKDGSCVDGIRIEKCLRSGFYRGDNSTCEGDSDSDGVDDACRTGACCIDGAKESVCENGSTRGSCAEGGGAYRGDDSICQGDDDGDGVDDLCERCSTATAGIVACDDGDFCTNDLCGLDGFCEHEDVDCDDGIPCTEDSCDSHEQRCVNDTTGCEVCIYALRCLDGDCANCPDLFMEGQECQDVACLVGICQERIVTTCGGPDCCVELELVDCRPEAGEPACPPFEEACECTPAGACCDLVTGDCTDDVPESDCPEKNSLHFPGLRCNEIPCGRGACCTPIVDSSGTPIAVECEDDVAWDECLMDPGSPFNEFKGGGTLCANVTCGGACCTDEECLEPLTPNGCRSFGGDYLGDGVPCPVPPGVNCTPCSTDEDCDDGIDCTDDACDFAVCVFRPNDTRCLDENRCTENERCDAAMGCVSDEVNCDDGKSCTIDTCDPAIGCLNGADNTRCEDGVDCTVDLCRPNRATDDTGCVYDPDDTLCPTKDLCVPGRCDPQDDCRFEPRECPDEGDACTREFCDSSTGECDDELLCGACCRVGQPCIDGLSEDQCGGAFDTFLGVGTACATAECGACCDIDTGACSDGITESECTAAGRSHQGPNTNCTQDPCLGACCDPGFTVSGCTDDVTAGECAAIDTDTIFMGVGSDCATASCGACCDPDSSDTGISCLNTATPELCAALGYVYVGDQTTCDPNPCKGACCLLDGSCVVTAPEDCPGDFRGNGTDCLELNPPCAAFTGGACCKPDGTCMDGTTVQTCADVHGGRHQGDGTRCADIDCPTTGACCLPDGECVQSTESGCPDGTFHGPGTTCPDACAGACCHPDGSCTVGPAQSCSGDYRGDGTNCAELNPTCTAFTGGACCRSDGSCADGTTPETCSSVYAGRHQGAKTRCADIDCPVTGACCLADGDCVQSTESGCPDGAFQGVGTSCADACAGACCLADGSCVVTSDPACSGDYRGDGTDCAELAPPCEPEALGACCTREGCVDDQTRKACESDPAHEFKGGGTRCDDVRCGGACCLPEGEPRCQFAPSRPLCENFPGGVYLGDGIICVETTCADCTSDQECVNGDRCDGDEFCDDGRCSSTPPPTIIDGINCTIDECDPKRGVTNTPDHEACDDGNPCREYFCDPNTGCDFESLCDDGNPCTHDVCVDAGVCVPFPILCEDDDSFFCNGGQVCVNGDCVPGPLPCDPVTEVCDEDRDRCTPRCEADADCDDAQFCNGFEICSLFIGGCVPGIGPCRFEDQVCDEAADTCRNICTPTAAGACVNPGDSNADGDVDLGDGRELFNFFGQQVGPGHPAEGADLNRDGRIGHDDVALFTQSMTDPH